MDSSDPKMAMKLSVDRLEADIARITDIVRSVERELGRVGNAAHQGSLLLAMKVQLGEIHSRLEGVREFVRLCRRRALDPRPQEDPEFWL